MKLQQEGIKLTLCPLSGWDQLRFANNVTQLLGSLMTVLGSREAAQSVAENCVLVYCATRGQLEGVSQPADLLYAVDLEDLAALARDYHAMAAGEEGGVNESFPTMA